jgi:hypothetical protein
VRGFVSSTSAVEIAEIRGLSDTLYRTLPHKHPPSLTFSLLIDGFSQDVARTARYRLPDYLPKCLEEETFSEVRLTADVGVRSYSLPQVDSLLVNPSGMYPGFRLRAREGDNLPSMSVVYGVLIVGAACLAAVVGLSVVQRLVPVTVRKEHNDVAGFIYAVLGVIYAVLLALVVIAV